MSIYEWLMVAGVCATLAIGFIGGIVRIIWFLSHKFDAAAQSREAQVESLRIEINSLRELFVTQLAAVELRHNARHEENIERVTRLETLVLNGHGKRKRHTV